MRVWRVAHRTARDRNGFPSGPYTSGGLPIAVSDALDGMRWDHCDDRHPNPYYDPSLERIQEEEHCGFSSLEALNDWFEHYWRVQLFVNDFRIYVYENDPADVRVGEYGQALFNRNRAVLLHTIEITD